MSRFNQYMNTGFSGCRLIAEGHDACRGRDVRVYLMPGYFDDVGFADGTDSWIVPLAAESCTGAGSLLKGINLRELVGKVRNGEQITVLRGSAPPAKKERRRVALDAMPHPAPETNTNSTNRLRRHRVAV